jgi:Na+-driven multidrug efflux pump
MLGVDGVWLALPASDTVAFIVTWIIMIRYMHKFKLQHQKQIYAA